MPCYCYFQITFTYLSQVCLSQLGPTVIHNKQSRSKRPSSVAPHSSLQAQIQQLFMKTPRRELEIGCLTSIPPSCTCPTARQCSPWRPHFLPSSHNLGSTGGPAPTDQAEHSAGWNQGPGMLLLANKAAEAFDFLQEWPLTSWVSKGCVRVIRPVTTDPSWGNVILCHRPERLPIFEFTTSLGSPFCGTVQRCPPRRPA